MKEDFNALLAKLKTAGLMAADVVVENDAGGDNNGDNGDDNGFTTANAASFLTTVYTPAFTET